MGFVRPYLLNVIAPRDGYDAGQRPDQISLGWEWMIKYSIIMVLIHHFILFYIETFKFHLFFSTFLRVILSSIFTIILIILSQLITQKK